jgi:hypothetical protein
VRCEVTWLSSAVEAASVSGTPQVGHRGFTVGGVLVQLTTHGVGGTPGGVGGDVTHVIPGTHTGVGVGHVTSGTHGVGGGGGGGTGGQVSSGMQGAGVGVGSGVGGGGGGGSTGGHVRSGMQGAGVGVGVGGGVGGGGGGGSTGGHVRNGMQGGGVGGGGVGGGGGGGVGHVRSGMQGGGVGGGGVGGGGGGGGGGGTGSDGVGSDGVGSDGVGSDGVGGGSGGGVGVGGGGPHRRGKHGVAVGSGGGGNVGVGSAGVGRAALCGAFVPLAEAAIPAMTTLLIPKTSVPAVAPSTRRLQPEVLRGRIAVSLVRAGGAQPARTRRSPDRGRDSDRTPRGSGSSSHDAPAQSPAEEARRPGIMARGTGYRMAPAASTTSALCDCPAASSHVTMTLSLGLCRAIAARSEFTESTLSLPTMTITS